MMAPGNPDVMRVFWSHFGEIVVLSFYEATVIVDLIELKKSSKLFPEIFPMYKRKTRGLIALATYIFLFVVVYKDYLLYGKDFRKVLSFWFWFQVFAVGVALIMYIKTKLELWKFEAALKKPK